MSHLPNSLTPYRAQVRCDGSRFLIPALGRPAARASCWRVEAHLRVVRQFKLQRESVGVGTFTKSLQQVLPYHTVESQSKRHPLNHVLFCFYMTP